MDGILNIRKERGFTSHDVVARLRGILKMRRIGHTGTLDPDAEGVLPVCLGRATRLCDRLTDKDKEYRTLMRLGVETDTQDMTGTVLKSCPVDLDENRIRDVILSFVGEYDQVPPMYSALKVNGKRLYELARTGQTVDRKPRRISIHSIQIDKIGQSTVEMTVICSRGTYIRTLCHDIGQKLGCAAAMERLVRTRSGQFCLKDSVSLKEVERYVQEERLSEIILPPDSLFMSDKRLNALIEGEKYLKNGNPMPLSLLSTDDPGTEYGNHEEVRIYDPSGNFIGLYRYEKDTERFKPEILFLP